MKLPFTYQNSEITVDHNDEDEEFRIQGHIYNDDEVYGDHIREVYLSVGTAVSLAQSILSYFEQDNPLDEYKMVLYAAIDKPAMSYDYGLGLMLRTLLTQANFPEINRLKQLDEDNWDCLLSEGKLFYADAKHWQDITEKIQILDCL